MSEVTLTKSRTDDLAKRMLQLSFNELLYGIRMAKDEDTRMVFRLAFEAKCELELKCAMEANES